MEQATYEQVLERAQAIRAQRDRALDELAVVLADLSIAQRRIADLEHQVKNALIKSALVDADDNALVQEDQ